MGQQEEEFSRKTSIVQPVLARKLDHQSLLQIVRALSHDLLVGILKYSVSADADVALVGDRSERRLRAEVNQLPTEVTLVLWDVCVQRGRQARIVPGRRSGVVVHTFG